MRKLLLFMTAFVLLSACGGTKESAGQDSQAKNVIPLVVDQQYQFTAREMQPQGGRSRYLNTTYFVRLTKEKVNVDLPYAGRAYTATPGSSDSPLRFEAPYEITSTDGKKGRKEVVIRPVGVDVREMLFTIYPGGTASLSVISNSRSSISFSGEVGPLPENK